VHATACWRIGSYAPGCCGYLYYAFIDHMIMELESRLIKSENPFYVQYLLPRVIGNITNEQIATLYETYQTDLTWRSEMFSWVN
jgi:hypothetical protein